MKLTKQLLFMFSFTLMLGSAVWADQGETEEVDINTIPEHQGDEKRGLLSVPDAVNLKPLAPYTTLLTTAILGSNTTTLSCCKVFQLTKSVTYTPTSEDTGCPMIHMVGKGATLDLCHNCITFNSSGTVGNCIGVEVGYSPNALGANTQPDSVTIENGILCNWDVAILVHAGVRNVTIRNMILTNNTMPIMMMGENDGDDNPVCTVYLENVSIIGDGQARLESLQWIRSKLTGNTVNSITALNPSGYTNNEVPQPECDPITDTATPADADNPVDLLEVYAGIYMNATQNIQLKNVSVANVGNDQAVAADTSEKTAAYGMWFRDCSSIFMEDVQSTKNKSGLTAVGMYFDNCCTVSAKNANISGNHVTDVGDTVGAGTNCPELRWAAAVVLRDTNVVEACDVVLSKTFGLENTFGVRVILNPVTGSNSYGFENVTADLLRGDRVYGFDLGDLYKKTGVGPATRQPAGAMRKLRMKNVSVSSCHGRNASGATNFPENVITTECKGIFLGDGSKDITLDDVRIESNIVSTTATGLNSGIEFGASSLAGEIAVGTISHARFNNLSITGNSGGLNTGFQPFSAIRVVSTDDVTPAATANIFEDVVISNSYLGGNEGQGIVARYSVVTAPVTLKNWTLDHVSCNGSTQYSGIFVNKVQDMTMKHVQANENNTDGLRVTDSVDGLYIFDSSFCNNTTEGIDLDVTTGNLMRNIEFENVNVNSNTSTGIDIGGISALSSFTYKGGQVNNNGGVAGIRFGNGADGAILQDLHISDNQIGIASGAAVDSLQINHCTVTHSNSHGLNIAAGGATALTLKDSLFNNNGDAGSGAGVEIVGALDGMVCENVQMCHNPDQGLNQSSGLASGIVITGSKFNENLEGIYLRGGVESMSVKNSTINHNNSSGCIISNTAANLSFDTVELNYNGGDGNLYLTTSTGLRMDHCQLNNNSSNRGLYVNGSATVMSLNDVTFNDNSQQGIEIVDDLTAATWDDVEINNNGGDGFNVTNLTNLRANRLTIDNDNNNSASGFVVQTNARNISINDFSISSNANGGLVFGSGNETDTAESIYLKNGCINNMTAMIDLRGAIKFDTVSDVIIDNVKLHTIKAESGSSIGMYVQYHANSVTLKDVDVANVGKNSNGATSNAFGLVFTDLQDGVFERVSVTGITGETLAYGMLFVQTGTTDIVTLSSSGSIAEPSIRNLSMTDIRVNGVFSEQGGDAFGVYMRGGINIKARNVDFSDVSSFNNTGDATGLNLFVFGTVGPRNGTQGFEGLDFDGFTFDHQQGRNAYGMRVQVEDNSLAATTKPLVNAVFKNGSASNNVAGATGAEVNGNAYGIFIQRDIAQEHIDNNDDTVGACDVTFENVTCSKNITNGSDEPNSVYGIRVQTSESITLKNVTANNNVFNTPDLVGAFNAYGILLETSVNNLQLFNVTASGNEAKSGNATGIQVDKATVVHADGVIANDNKAEGQNTNNVAEVKGIFFKASVGSEQSAGCVMNNLQACGNHNAFRAYGIHLQEPTGLTMEHVDASSNKSDALGLVGSAAVLSQSVGLYLEGGCAVKVSDVHASVNTQAEVDSASLARTADGELSTNANETEGTVNTTADIARHFPVANRSGAYGVLADGTQALTIDGGAVNKNEGVRAFGLFLRDGADNAMVQNLDASENYGKGNSIWFGANPFNGLTATAIAIPVAQAPTIYGDPAGPVNLQESYAQYLKALSRVNSTAISGNAVSLCSQGAGEVGAGSVLSATADIIWATIAQYRRFVTGIGIGVYNSDCVTIDNCRSMGNHSDKDTAAGIAMYGCGSKAQTVTNCTASCNKAWTDSQRGGAIFDIDGDIDISAWGEYDTFVGTMLLDSETVAACPTKDSYGFIAVPTLINQTAHIVGVVSPGPGMRKPTALTQPDCATTETWTLNERRMSVGGIAGTEDIYNYATVGPISAGIALEGQRDSNVLNNNTYSNAANAGLAFGILSDATSSTMFMDNKATGNEADTLGYAWGLADMSYSTPNIWYKNWMYANRVDVYMNSALHIVFDSAFSAGQALPLQLIQPGSVESLMRALPLDNIVVEFSNCRQIENCLGDCVKQHLFDLSSVDSLTNPGNSANIITAVNTTSYPGCPTCA